MEYNYGTFFSSAEQKKEANGQSVTLTFSLASVSPNRGLRFDSDSTHAQHQPCNLSPGLARKLD